MELEDTQNNGLTKKRKIEDVKADDLKESLSNPTTYTEADIRIESLIRRKKYALNKGGAKEHRRKQTLRKKIHTLPIRIAKYIKDMHEMVRAADNMPSLKNSEECKDLLQKFNTHTITQLFQFCTDSQTTSPQSSSDEEKEREKEKEKEKENDNNETDKEKEEKEKEQI